MSDPIVIELQRLASDGDCPVDQLLRKAFLVATKLNVQDFRDWITSEMNGYSSGENVPEYRKALAQIHVFNNVQGRLIPFYLPEDIETNLRRTSIIQSLGDLVQLAASSTTVFDLQIDPAVRNMLLAVQGDFPMEPRMVLSRIYITKVIDAVRNTILEWSLRLESQGILGVGMQFSSEEKAIAMSSQNVHIGSFQGILGNVANSTVDQRLEMQVNTGNFESLQQTLKKIGLERSDIETLSEAIQSDSKPQSAAKFGPRVSAWIGSMMSKAASGAWKITLDSAGKLLPAAIAAYYGLEV